ncbi:MAG: succinate dehydrogenase, cytochrome b556 subunit [Rhodocyclaceae bacterium]|nr:succinate dehydrogenase, cytochrome b556 subunit [Rhodocyclaceae bacterium]
MRKHATRRPRFLNLLQMRYPVGAIVSIGHRLSGLLLIAALPALVIGLEWSLRSEADFRQMCEVLWSPWARGALVLMIWALAHHVAAGVRHLLMDAGVGSRLPRARASARLAIVFAVLCALAAAAGWRP